jgi:hypothetical protein
MLERIYNEFVGDEYTEGVIHKVQKNTKKLNQHDLYFKIGIGIIVVLSFLFTFIESAKCVVK